MPFILPFKPDSSGMNAREVLPPPAPKILTQAAVGWLPTSWDRCRRELYPHPGGVVQPKNTDYVKKN
jgi:hypothetical protein